MNQILELLQNLNTPLIAAGITALFALITFVYSKRKDIKGLWDYVYNRRKTREELFAMVAQNQEDIKSFQQLFEMVTQNQEAIKILQQTIKQYADNRVSDRNQSLGIQRNWLDSQQKTSDSITELSKSVSELSRKLDVMQTNTDQRFYEEEERNNKRIRAELKDRISQTYRYHHGLQEINDMELEALEDLIEEYESAKGENSFVHSVVQKEMYTWERVERK